MKKILILIIFLMIFIYIYNVSAACADDNQKILRISADTDAHGEIWNATPANYPSFCYSEIFGQDYVVGVGENPHGCKDIDGDGVVENGLIKLSAETDAHAEIRSCTLSSGHMWWNGYTRFITAKTGVQNIKIRASGDKEGSILPHMQLKINNVVVNEWDIDSIGYGDWHIYSADSVDLSSINKIYIYFTNDAELPGQDVNLYLDYIEIGNDVNGYERIYANGSITIYCRTDLNNYAFPVCYGNLICTPREGICLGNEKTVLSLSGKTDAHISKGDDPNFNQKICCRSPSALSKNIFWANMSAQPITESRVRESVKMIFNNTDLSEGTEISFEVKERVDLWADTDIRVGANAITATVNSNGDAIGIWEITIADYEKSSNHDNYYFRAVVEGRESNEMRILGGYCKDDGRKWIDEAGSIWDTTTTRACLDYDKTCCPNFYYCSESQGKCAPRPAWCDDIFSCSNYTETETAQENCNEDPCGVGQEGEIEWQRYGLCGQQGEIGGIFYSHECLGCAWESDICYFKVNYTEIGSDDTDYYCDIDTTVGPCIGNIRTIDWEAILKDKNGITYNDLADDFNCTSGSSDYPCGEKQLPFFGLFQFMGVLILTLLFYLSKSRK